MADIAELGFVVKDQPLEGAVNKLDRLVPASDRAAKATDRFNKAANDNASATGKMAGGLSSLTTVAIRFASGMAAAFSIGVLANYADAWSDMQSRVGAAIKDMEAAPALMQRLVDIANASYSPLAQTVEIYGRNAATLRDLGRNAAEAADFTESLNHMLVITATRGERAESVQNALSKAMAVGKLQADGLETVLANGGRVAEALAAELGTTVSGLRKFASEGKITGDVIARAIIKPLADVREEAAAMPATITDAFTILNNNVTAAIGTLDKATGASSAVAEVIMTVANNLDIVTAAFSGVAAVVLTAMIPALVTATGVVWTFTAALLANPLTWVAIAIGVVVAAIVLLIQRLGGVGEAFHIVRETAIDTWERISAAVEAFGATMNRISDEFTAYLTAKWVEVLRMILNGVSQINNAFGTAFDLTGIVNTTADAMARVDQYSASAAAHGEQAATAWERVFAARSRSDSVGDDAGSFADFTSQMSAASGAASSLSTGIAGVGAASGAANDNVKQLTSSTGGLTEAQRELNNAYEFGKQTFSSFLGDFKNELANGGSLWDAFGKAAVNALNSIADRALSMAANGIWDMIFGGLTGGGGGGNWLTSLFGGATRGARGGRGGSFDTGGYTGGGSTSAVAGIVHGQEFVMNAAATNRIGVGTLQAMNDNMSLPTASGGNVISIDFRPVYHIDGVGLSMDELQEVIQRNNEQMMDELPDRLNAIQNDPRKRVVNY